MNFFYVHSQYIPQIMQKNNPITFRVIFADEQTEKMVMKTVPPTKVTAEPAEICPLCTLLYVTLFLLYISMILLQAVVHACPVSEFPRLG